MIIIILSSLFTLLHLASSLNIQCSDTLCLNGKCDKKDSYGSSTECICNDGWKGDYCDRMIFNNEQNLNQFGINKAHENDNNNDEIYDKKPNLYDNNNRKCRKPCRNNGVCKILGDDEICECLDNFRGNFCQLEKSNKRFYQVF
jgi:hypothetical protein